MTEQPGTDLVYGAAPLQERRGYAQTLAAAGDLIPKSLFSQVRQENGTMVAKPSAGKIFLVAETGSMLGIHPIAALNGVNVIEGKPTISPGLMSALVRRAGHKLRVRTTGSVEDGDFTVVATLVRRDDPDEPFSSTWTPHRAARAGLCKYEQRERVWKVTARSKSGSPLPWESYTEALCTARAIGEVCRQGAEDALMGVHYTPEELGATVDAEGTPVDDAIEGEIVDDEPHEQPEPEQSGGHEQEPEHPKPKPTAKPKPVSRGEVESAPDYEALEALLIRARATGQVPLEGPIGVTPVGVALVHRRDALSAELPETGEPGGEQ